jgi:hypothetical protein
MGFAARAPTFAIVAAEWLRQLRRGCDSWAKDGFSNDLPPSHVVTTDLDGEQPTGLDQDSGGVDHTFQFRVCIGPPRQMSRALTRVLVWSAISQSSRSRAGSSFSIRLYLFWLLGFFSSA